MFRRKRKTHKNEENETSHTRYSGNTLRNVKRLSEEERRVDALALRADEGRDKLRKALVRSKYPMIQRYPNGET